MCAKSASTPDDFYDIVGGSFGKPSSIVSEFRDGGRPPDNSSPLETGDSTPAFGISEQCGGEYANVGSVKAVRGLNWAFGDMYSSEPANVGRSSPSGNPAPKTNTHFL